MSENLDDMRTRARQLLDDIAEESMMEKVNEQIFWGPAHDFMFHGTLPGGNKAGIDPALPDLTELYDKVADLSRKIDLIFGDHVLINGKFINIKE